MSCWKNKNPVDNFTRISKESLARLKLWSKEEFSGRKREIKQLREGDKNTKFFHAKASARKKKNKISGLEDDSGKWIEE